MVRVPHHIDRSKHIPKKSENTQHNNGWVSVDIPDEFERWRNRLIDSGSFRESVEREVADRLSKAPDGYPAKLELVWGDYGPIFSMGAHCSCGPHSAWRYGSNNVDTQFQADILHVCLGAYMDKLLDALDELERKPDSFSDPKPIRWSGTVYIREAREGPFSIRK